MTAEEFAASDGERRIFVAALREFSDQCFSPTLTPSCPFYERTASGPSCGEQCRDILAEYAEYGEGRPRDLLDWGDGMTAYRRPGRQPRRGPEPTALPFDAAAITMRDRDRTTDARHSVSLLYDLKSRLAVIALKVDDPDEHAYIIEAYIEELERRGFNRSHLMSACAELSARGASIAMALRFIVAEVPEAPNLDDGFELSDKWTEVQSALLPPGRQWSGREALQVVANTAFVEGLTRWNASLTPQELAAGTPPPINLIETGFSDLAAPGILSNRYVGRWIFDRFTQTYLDHWDLSSLKLEWKYLHSKVKGCADADTMRLRRVDANDLARALAEMVTESSSEQQERHDSFRPADFVAITVDYLENGNYQAAVAIYEGFSVLSPTDAAVWNNLGFCLIPIDPHRALGALARSAALSDSVKAMTKCNQALAYLLTGDKSTAIEVAQAVLALPSEPGLWLWSVDPSGRLTLTQGRESIEYAQELISMLKSNAEAD